MEPFLRPLNYLIVMGGRKHFTQEAIISRIECHELREVDYILNWIGFTIIACER